MVNSIRKVEYFYTTVEDRPGEAYRVLAGLADSGIDLVAMNAIPVGASRTLLTLFPADPAQLRTVADRVGMRLEGPYAAFLVQGDDEIGAVARVLQRLADAGVNLYASSGVASGAGRFGYLLHVRSEDMQRASQALGLAV